MATKSFFRERTAAQIRMLKVKQVYSQRGLVKRILELNPSEEGLELRVRIIPGRFFKNTASHAEASRKCYRFGELISLSQPERQKDAYECREIPLAVRARDFMKNLENRKEEDIHYIGYSFRPVQGRDRRKRVVPFAWLLEAARLYAYAGNRSYGITVNPYDDAARVRKEGASIFCDVPSRTRKKPRYVIRLDNVPVKGTNERMAVVWGIKSDFKIDPEHSKWNIRYTWAHDREGRDRFTFYPHDIAAYIAVMMKYYEKHNLTPLEMNPFALPSKKEVEEFYKKLCNNVVIFDPTLSSSGKSRKRTTRKLHIAEKSILIARSISVLGHDESMYWEPSRDGLLENYNWTIR